MPGISPLTLKVIANANGMQSGMDAAVAAVRAGSGSIRQSFDTLKQVGNLKVNLLGMSEAKANLDKLTNILNDKKISMQIGAKGFAAAQAQADALARHIVGLQEKQAAAQNSLAGRAAQGVAAVMNSALVKGIAGAAAGLKTVVGAAFTGGLKLEGLIEKAIGNPGRFLADNVLGGIGKIASSIPMLGPLIALPFEAAAGAMGALMDLYDSGSARIKAMAMSARQANVDLGQFQVISLMLKDSDAAAQAMIRFGKSLTAASMAGIGAKNAFTRLGLDATALMAMRTDDALGAIGDKLNGLQNKFLQNSYAMEIFGKKASTILPALLRGSGGVAKARGLLEGSGGAFSEKDFQNIREAEAAMKQIKILKEALGTQVAIGVAPIIAEFMTQLPKLSALGITFKGVGAIVIEVAEVIAKAGGLAWESWKDTTLVTDSVAAAFGFIQSSAIYTVGLIKDEFGKTFEEIGYGLGRIGKKLRDSGMKDMTKGSEGNRKALDDMAAVIEKFKKTASFDYLTNSFDKIRNRFNGVGMPPTDNGMAVVWAKKAQEIAEALEGPLDKFRDKFLEISAVIKNTPVVLKSIGLQALGKQYADLQSTHTAKKFTSAAQQFSTEAYSDITKDVYGDHNQSVQERLKLLTEEANAQRKQQIEVGLELIRLFKANPGLIPRSE